MHPLYMEEMLTSKKKGSCGINQQSENYFLDFNF